MTALLQGKIKNDQVNFDADGPIVAHLNGFPYTDKGGIAISSGPADHYHQGIPFDANGRMCMIAGSVNYWGGGAAPFNTGPEIAFGSVLDHYSSGVPYTPGGALIAGAVPPNVIPNSTWRGASGSVSGGDFVPPDGWGTGFWPPDDAIAIDNGDYTSIRFIALNNQNRGYIEYNLGTPFPVGTIVNLSINVDECLVGTGAQRVVHFNTQGGTNPREIRTVRPVTPGDTGRFDAVYEILDDQNPLQVRVGTGTTANDNHDYTLSRPQITVGEVGWPYQPTLPVPIFQDNFLGLVGTSLVDHDPDIGGGYTALGSALQLDGNGGCTPSGTGTGTGQPNYWSNLTDATSATPKLIQWRATDFGDGTSLAVGVTVLTAADGTAKVTCGLRNNGMYIQTFQAGAIADTEFIADIERPGNGNYYPRPFFAIVEGTTVTYGYGDPFNPVFEVTRDFAALAGLGDAIGLIGRATGVNTISELAIYDW